MRHREVFGRRKMTTKTPPKRISSPIPPAEATSPTRQGLEDSITYKLHPSILTKTNTKLEQLPESAFANFKIKSEISGEELYQLVCPLINSDPEKARVFLALGKESGRKVVVKRFLEFDQGQWIREKVIQNILYGRGEHKNLLLAKEFLDEQRMIIYPYIPGGDLREFQRREGPLNPYQAQGLVNALLTALQILHQYNIIHRDVKPGNIVLDRSDLTLEKITAKNLESLQVVPKLFDYETAWHPDIMEDPDTIMGTPHYMAPEIIKGKKHEKRDKRIDIYAAGVTIFHLLTGHFPFDAGKNIIDASEREKQIYERHLQAPVPDATEIIGADLQYIFETSMAKDPGQRYQTALEFKQAFNEALR